jgi:hypothetical protein
LRLVREFLRPRRAHGKPPRRRRTTEDRDELAPSYVEHGASSPLWTGGTSNDHQSAHGPCSFAAGSAYHGGWEEVLGAALIIVITH